MSRSPLVLVAEGHDDTRTLLTTLFRLHGFEVVDSGTGADAIGLAYDLEPDVVVLDRRLCRQSTSSLPRQIRAAARGPLIVTIADPGDWEDQARALADGCDVYLEKPVDVLSLVELVRSRAAADGRVGRRPGGQVH